MSNKAFAQPDPDPVPPPEDPPTDDPDNEGDDDNSSTETDDQTGLTLDAPDFSLPSASSPSSIHLLDQSAFSDNSSSSKSNDFHLGNFDFAASSTIKDAAALLSSGIPSAIDRSESIFDRVSSAYQRIFGDTQGLDLRNDGAAARLADTASNVCEQERSARANDKSFVGTWGRDSERGPLSEGDYKCNLAFGEWSEKAGLTPIYREGAVYADTKFIVGNQNNLNCWRPTDDPKRGDAIVIEQKSGATHIGVVTDPDSGKAVSAGTQVTSEYRHWGTDANGIARPIWNPRDSATDLKDPLFSQRPAVLFLEYHCPDQRTLDHFPYDN